METLSRFFFLWFLTGFFFFLPLFSIRATKKRKFHMNVFSQIHRTFLWNQWKNFFSQFRTGKRNSTGSHTKNFFSLVPHIIIFFMCETNEKTFLMRSDFFFCKWINFFREFFFTNFFFTFGFSRHFCSTQKSYIFSWRRKIFHLVLHRNLQTNFTQLDEVNFFRILFFFYILFLSFFRVLSRFFHPQKFV